MAKFISCPKCSNAGVSYLMLPQKKREYDEELKLPVTVYIHDVCKTQMRIIGLVCIDCSGTGQCEREHIVISWLNGHKTAKVVEGVGDCPHCGGLGIIPKRYIIIPGDGSRPSRATHTSLETSIIDDGIAAAAADNDGRLFGCGRRGRGRGNMYTGNW